MQSGELDKSPTRDSISAVGLRDLAFVTVVSRLTWERSVRTSFVQPSRMNWRVVARPGMLVFGRNYQFGGGTYSSSCAGD